MQCQCGSSEEIYVGGHHQCARCGRMNDGDCCQGMQLCAQEKRKDKSKIDTNYEAVDY
jgi:hypothetical protein